MRGAGVLALTVVVSLGVGSWIGALAKAGALGRDSAEQTANLQANDALVRQVAGRIAGRESEPAEQVFKNIQWLKGGALTRAPGRTRPVSRPAGAVRRR